MTNNRRPLEMKFHNTGQTYSYTTSKFTDIVLVLLKVWLPFQIWMWDLCSVHCFFSSHMPVPVQPLLCLLANIISQGGFQL